MRHAGRGPDAGRSLTRGAPRRKAGRGGDAGPLASTLFGLTRQDVLGLLYARPDEPFYVREVARLTGGAVGAVQRELTALVSAGILERTVKGRQVYFQADPTCPIFAELKSIVAKIAVIPVLRKALAAHLGSIDAAFVFGSVARGSAGNPSDIDVFVVGQLRLSDVVDAFADSESALGREINPVVQTADEFSRRVAAGDHFVTRVIAEFQAVSDRRRRCPWQTGSGPAG